MRGITKAINAESARISGFAIGTITDQPRAKQRRNLDIIVTVRQMKTESCIGDSEFRITAIDGVAGETRSIAQIFPVRSTIGAFAIGPAKPRNADTVANFEFRIYFFSDLFDIANNLVTWYERQFWIRQFAIDHVKIGPAHRARNDSHKQLSLGRPWFLHVAELERLPRLIQNHRAHGASPRHASKAFKQLEELNRGSMDAHWFGSHLSPRGFAFVMGVRAAQETVPCRARVPGTIRARDR